MLWTLLSKGCQIVKQLNLNQTIQTEFYLLRQANEAIS